MNGYIGKLTAALNVMCECGVVKCMSDADRPTDPSSVQSANNTAADEQPAVTLTHSVGPTDCVAFEVDVYIKRVRNKRSFSPTGISLCTAYTMYDYELLLKSILIRKFRQIK